MKGAIFPKEDFSGRMSLELVSSWYLYPLLYYFATQKIPTALVEDSEAAASKALSPNISRIYREIFGKLREKGDCKPSLRH